jgi:hypothetical protein
MPLSPAPVASTSGATRICAGFSRSARAAIGIGALYGGISLLPDPEGFGVEESWLDGTPFPSYTIPGLFLLVVIGGGMLGAAATALLGSRWTRLAAFCLGLALLLFLSVETVAIGYQGPAQLGLVAITGIPAIVLVVLGSKALR